MLDPFKKYQKRSDEDVKFQLVRFRSHVNFTFHIPVSKNFDRKSVLPADQMKLLMDLSAKIKKEQQNLQRLQNQKKFFCQDIVYSIIKRAADELFDTPKVS